VGPLALAGLYRALLAHQHERAACAPFAVPARGAVDTADALQDADAAALALTPPAPSSLGDAQEFAAVLLAAVAAPVRDGADGQADADALAPATATAAAPSAAAAAAVLSELTLRCDVLLRALEPPRLLQLARSRLADRMSGLVRRALSGHAAVVGAAAAAVALPTDPLHVGAFLCHGQEKAWVSRVAEILLGSSDLFDVAAEADGGAGTARGAMEDPAAAASGSSFAPLMTPFPAGASRLPRGVIVSELSFHCPVQHLQQQMQQIARLGFDTSPAASSRSTASMGPAAMAMATVSSAGSLGGRSGAGSPSVTAAVTGTSALSTDGGGSSVSGAGAVPAGALPHPTGAAQAASCPPSVAATMGDVRRRVCGIAGGVGFEVSVNRLSELAAAALIDEVDAVVGQNALFKRSILLFRAWLAYDGAHFLPTARALELQRGGTDPDPFLFLSGFGSGGGCISAWWSQGATAASEYVRQRSGGLENVAFVRSSADLPLRAVLTILLWVFGRRRASIQHPLHALLFAISDLAAFDFEAFALTPLGPVPKHTVTEAQALFGNAVHALEKQLAVDRDRDSLTERVAGDSRLIWPFQPPPASAGGRDEECVSAASFFSLVPESAFFVLRKTCALRFIKARSGSPAGPGAPPTQDAGPGGEPHPQPAPPQPQRRTSVATVQPAIHILDAVEPLLDTLAAVPPSTAASFREAVTAASALCRSALLQQPRDGEPSRTSDLALWTSPSRQQAAKYSVAARLFDRLLCGSARLLMGHAPYESVRGARADALPGLCRALADSSTAGPGISTYGALQPAEPQGLRRAVEYASLLLDSEVTESSLIGLTTEILQSRGGLPVGEIGKLLQEATSRPGISGILKERFGGLKRFLESKPEIFFLDSNHPFNPHVYLRNGSHHMLQQQIHGGAHALHQHGAGSFAALPPNSPHGPVPSSHQGEGPSAPLPAALQQQAYSPHATHAHGPGSSHTGTARSPTDMSLGGPMIGPSADGAAYESPAPYVRGWQHRAGAASAASMPAWDAGYTAASGGPPGSAPNAAHNMQRGYSPQQGVHPGNMPGFPQQQQQQQQAGGRMPIQHTSAAAGHQRQYQQQQQHLATQRMTLQQHTAVSGGSARPGSGSAIGGNRGGSASMPTPMPAGMQHQANYGNGPLSATSSQQPARFPQQQQQGHGSGPYNHQQYHQNGGAANSGFGNQSSAGFSASSTDPYFSSYNSTMSNSSSMQSTSTASNAATSSGSMLGQGARPVSQQQQQYVQTSRPSNPGYGFNYVQGGAAAFDGGYNGGSAFFGLNGSTNGFGSNTLPPLSSFSGGAAPGTSASRDSLLGVSERDAFDFSLRMSDNVTAGANLNSAPPTDDAFTSLLGLGALLH
jgi:hypothetical protein